MTTAQLAEWLALNASQQELNEMYNSSEMSFRKALFLLYDKGIISRTYRVQEDSRPIHRRRRSI